MSQKQQPHVLQAAELPTLEPPKMQTSVRETPGSHPQWGRDHLLDPQA